MSNFTVDSSFLVKGLVPVRRPKEDALRAQQEREFQLARDYLTAIEQGIHQMFVPAITLVEVAAVISRLTNSREDARSGADFVRRNATRLYYESDLLERAIENAITTKIGGYDTIFLTVAKITGSMLLTANRFQHQVASAIGLKSVLLYDLMESKS